MRMIMKTKISMDLTNPAVQPVIDVMQDDKYSRDVEISMHSAGRAFTLPDITGVLIRYNKPDGTYGEYDTLPDGSCAWYVSENTVTIRLAPQIGTVPGKVYLSISLLRGEAQLSLFGFSLQVHPLPQGRMRSENYISKNLFLPQLNGAAAGQYLRISDVDGGGRVATLEPVDLKALSYVPQQLTEEEKLQARENIAAAPANHTSDRNNPHSVTARQVGALSDAGGTITGALTIKKSSPSLEFVSGDHAAAKLYKNASEDLSVDYGTILRDYDADGNYTSLIVKGAAAGGNNLYLLFSGSSQRYPIYGEHNKPTAADVGARADTWMPTATQVGAAPAGYGLGETNGRLCTDLNTAVTIGFYRLDGANTVNYPPLMTNARYGTMTVEIRGTYIGQTVSYRNNRAIRFSADKGSTWSDWEYVNPEMKTGVEYRTTERFNGNPVYCKLVDLGELPNTGSKRIGGWAGLVETVDYYGSAKDSSGWTVKLPYEGCRIDLQAPDFYVHITTTSDHTGFVGQLMVKYTKE